MSPSHPQALVVADSRQVLSRHARSFRLAAAFLPEGHHDDAAVLYAFCRAVDDAVDEASDVTEARHALRYLDRQLRGPDPTDPLVAELHRLARRRGLPLRAAEQLVEGVAGDLEPVRIPGDGELIRYCYHAAGTVGLMMCAVLGVSDRRAQAHAIDLGIAMQLTNICRDVLEDARRGRIYLPAPRLAAAGVDPRSLLQGQAEPERVAVVVRDLLAVAERYYQSADAGMRYIPPRPRLAILVASRVYRAIGRRLVHRYRGDALRGRCVVPAWAKLAWVVAAVVTWATLPLRRRRFAGAHRSALHEPLGSLIGSRSVG